MEPKFLQNTVKFLAVAEMKAWFNVSEGKCIWYQGQNETKISDAYDVSNASVSIRWVNTEEKLLQWEVTFFVPNPEQCFQEAYLL